MYGTRGIASVDVKVPQVVAKWSFRAHRDELRSCSWISTVGPFLHCLVLPDKMSHEGDPQVM